MLQYFENAEPTEEEPVEAAEAAFDAALASEDLSPLAGSVASALVDQGERSSVGGEVESQDMLPAWEDEVLELLF